MRKRLGVAAFTVPVLAFLFAFPLSLTAQSRGSLITQPINENVLHRLAGNTRPQATAENDAGPVPDSLSMEHMLLQMQRPAEQETALRQLIDSRSEEHTSELQSLRHLVCRLLLEKKKTH